VFQFGRDALGDGGWEESIDKRMVRLVTKRVGQNTREGIRVNVEHTAADFHETTQRIDVALTHFLLLIVDVVMM